MEGTLSCNPQTVLRQLYDQGAIIIIGEMGNFNILTVEARLVGEGREQFWLTFKQFSGQTEQGLE